MSTSSFSEDDLFQLDAPEEDGHATEVIELESPTVADDYTGPCCAECAGPLQGDQMSVCPNCGWYARLGIFVEVDNEWDQATAAAKHGSTPLPKQSHLQVWLQLLPWYAWLTIFVFLGVLVESAFIRIVFADSSLRTTWSLCQLGLGAASFTICHFLNFINLSSDDSSTGLLDFLLRPLRVWLHAARQLPRKLVVFEAGVMGLAAVVGSVAIIGGIPYDRLLDWGFKEPPKQNLMGAVMDQAKEHTPDEDMTMEEAVNDLAGHAGGDRLNNADSGNQPELPEPVDRKKIDCVILGFRANTEGKVHTLILAAEHRGQLRYAGRVTPLLEEDENAELLESLLAERTAVPFMPLQVSAEWVRPVHSCRVSFTDRSKDGRLEKIEWLKMLGKLNY